MLCWTEITVQIYSNQEEDFVRVLLKRNQTSNVLRSAKTWRTVTSGAKPHSSVMQSAD